MVRLKVYTSNGAGSSEVISIPYGAIKRNCIGAHSAEFIKFQFLMVRLKGNAVALLLHQLPISIPYGAIKSAKPGGV